jgi:TrmH family RNA methyltransferase
VARCRALARGRGAGDPVLLDGAHLVSVALEAKWPLEVVALDADLVTTHADLADLARRLDAEGALVLRASARVLDAMSPVRTPSGVVALGRAPVPAVPAGMLGAGPAFVLVAVGVQDPGNLGAILRVADAASATGVIATQGSADPFGWKALRGSMGSGLRVPVWPNARLPEVRAFLGVHQLGVVAADPSGARAFTDVDLTRPVAVLLGAEGHGLPPDVLAWADTRARIPMRHGVESLNVAVTAALLAYEAQRQRRKE